MLFRSNELIPLLAAEFTRRTTDDWLTAIKAVGIPVSAINDVRAVLHDPHVRARGMVQEIDGVAVLGPVAKLSATPARIRHAPPRLGEDTDAVLLELRLSLEEISELRSKRVI